MAIRRVIRDEDEITRNRIVESLIANRDRDFWSEIKKIKARGRNVPSAIDSCSKPEDIANLFAGSYKQLFSSAPSADEEMESVRARMNHDFNDKSVGKSFVVCIEDTLLTDLIKVKRMEKAC
jgi:hypothetical protein